MNIKKIAEEILWDEVSSYIENVEEFHKMIDSISYIDHKKAHDVEWCETFETEGINILEYDTCEQRICIAFEMPFILSAWDSEQQLFRVTASVKGNAILVKEELIEIHNITYDDIEVDSVYL